VGEECEQSHRWINASEQCWVNLSERQSKGELRYERKAPSKASALRDNEEANNARGIRGLLAKGQLDNQSYYSVAEIDNGLPAVLQKYLKQQDKNIEKPDTSLFEDRRTDEAPRMVFRSKTQCR
jgi:redox-sensitive bicupin YhaK (pirin superfamily)